MFAIKKEEIDFSILCFLQKYTTNKKKMKAFLVFRVGLQC